MHSPARVIDTQSAAAPGYGNPARVFHWVTAALIFVLVPLGLTAHWLPDGEVRSTILDSYHKPLGVLVIVLTLAHWHGWPGRRPRSTLAGCGPGKCWPPGPGMCCSTPSCC